MECQAITNVGTQCSRKALINSKYCWQHQNYESGETKESNSSLILKALQPEIISNIKNYAGILGNFSKALNENTNKNLILKIWFKEIGVQTPFEKLTENDIKLLWPLYIKRIANAPAKDLLKTAISMGLNPYIFHSRTIEYEGDITNHNFSRRRIREILGYGYDAERDSLLKHINQTLVQFIVDKKIRKGDMVSIEEIDYQTHYADYHTIPHVIYDGKELVYTDLEYYPNSITVDLPSSFIINEYPTTNYFYDSTDNQINNTVDFDTSDTKYQLVEEYQISEKDKVYQYLTTGKSSDYTIWINKPITNKYWHGVLVFDSDIVKNDSRSVITDFITYIEALATNKVIKDRVMNVLKNNQSLRTLYSRN
jgi:hypothetical protein